MSRGSRGGNTGDGNWHRKAMDGVCRHAASLLTRHMPLKPAPNEHFEALSVVPVMLTGQRITTHQISDFGVIPWGSAPHLGPRPTHLNAAPDAETHRLSAPEPSLCLGAVATPQHLRPRPSDWAIAGLPRLGVSRGRGVALAAWHTLWGGGWFVSTQLTHTDLATGSFAGFGESVGLDLPAMSAQTAQQVRDRLVSRDFDAWSEAVARVGNCSHPIRLRRLVAHGRQVDRRNHRRPTAAAMSRWESPTSAAETAAPANACPAHGCMRRTCSTSSAPASPAAKPSPPPSQTTHWCSPP